MKKKKRHRDLKGRNKNLFGNNIGMYIERFKESQRKKVTRTNK